MKKSFTNRSVQRVMMDNADDPDLIARLWSDFTKPRTTPLQSKRFSDYLRYLKYATSVKVKSLLTDVFGSDFLKLGTKAKNVQVLATTEKQLSKKLLAGIENPAASEFSENLLKKVDDMLGEDLIKEAQTLEGARQKIVSRLNKILGEEAMDFTEVRKIISETQQTATSGSIFEHWVRKKIKSLGKASLRLADNTLVKIDGHRIEKGFAIFTEAKWRPKGTTLSGHDIVQLENYAEILDEGIKFSSNGKNLPIKFEYIFDNINAAKKNYEVISQTLGLKNVNVFYITKSGQKKLLK